jgi:hypothetical protein
MKAKFYLETIRRFSLAIMGMLLFSSSFAAEYADTTYLKSDIEAGLFEEYILTSSDTFFLSDINPISSFVLKASDELTEKPIVVIDDGNWLFDVEAEGLNIALEGLRITSRNPKEADGAFRLLAPGVNISLKNCVLYDFHYNAIALIRYSDGSVTIDDCFIYNVDGKIVQADYRNPETTLMVALKDVRINNSTFANVATRQVFEFGTSSGRDFDGDGVNDLAQAGADNFIMTNCVVDGVLDNEIIKFNNLRTKDNVPGIKDTVMFRNNIFTNCVKTLSIDSCSVLILEDNYFGGIAPSDYGKMVIAFGDTTAELGISSQYGDNFDVTIAPQYTDAENYDFTLTNETEFFANMAIGDRRWWSEDILASSDSFTDNWDNSISISLRHNRLTVGTSNVQKGYVAIYDLAGRLQSKSGIYSDKTEFIVPVEKLLLVVVKTDKGTKVQKVIAR